MQAAKPSFLGWLKSLFFRAPKPEVSREQALDAQEQRVLAEFCRQYSIPFRDLSLLKLALTHRSYLSVTGQGPRESNERLEFLGDSVLGLTTSEYLYRRHPDEHEGQLTKTKSLLVSKAILSRRALRMGLGRFVLMSHSEVESGGRQRLSILADAFESVLGAIYLDQGFEAARAFIHQHLLSESDAITSDKRHTNYKSHLQEYVQNAFRTHPVYRIRSEYGPDHSKHFMVEVMVGRRTLGEGRGHNKKEAEQAAARDALEKVEKVRRSAREEGDAEVDVAVVEETREREPRRGRGGRDRDDERGGRGRDRDRDRERPRDEEAERPAPVSRPEPVRAVPAEAVEDTDDERDDARDEGEESANGRRRRRRRGGRRRGGARDAEGSERTPHSSDDEPVSAPSSEPSRQSQRDSFVEAVRAEMREITGDDQDDDQEPEPLETARRDTRAHDDDGRTFTPAAIAHDDDDDDDDADETAWSAPARAEREVSEERVVREPVAEPRPQPATPPAARPQPVAFGRGRRRNTPAAAPAAPSGPTPGPIDEAVAAAEAARAVPRAPEPAYEPEPELPPVVDVTPPDTEPEETEAEREARIDEMERALDNFGRRRSPDYGRRGRRR